jgi:hypothetical protein
MDTLKNAAPPGGDHPTIHRAQPEGPVRLRDRGINRWAIRGFAYASLMRDEYPPYRLDDLLTGMTRYSGVPVSLHPAPG